MQPLHYAKPRVLTKNPKVVCLCGSTRFMDDFTKADQELTGQGIITTGVALLANEKEPDFPVELKRMLDELHFRKIDLADEIYVVNVGGYAGYSTDREIRYAYSTRKPIRSLEPIVWQWCGDCETMGILSKAEHYCGARDEDAA